MELILNLIWALTATAMSLLWLRFGLRGSRRIQVVSLVVLLLVLFPVISVSDDLVSLQNAAEVDSWGRRHHEMASVISFVPHVVAAFLFSAADLLPSAQHLSAFEDAPTCPCDHPALASIDNRPPPAV
jgi:hypothetical protein